MSSATILPRSDRVCRVGRGNLTPSRSQNRAYPSRSTRLVASMQPCPAADRPYELLPHTVVGPLRLPWTPRPLGSTRITELPSYYEAVRPCALRSVLYLSLVPSLRISRHGRAGNPRPTILIAGRVRRGQPSSFRVTGSHVPHQSPSQARAAFMPDTAWAVSRYLPGCSRDRNPVSVLMSSKERFDTSSAVHLRSPSWLPPDELVVRRFRTIYHRGS